MADVSWRQARVIAASIPGEVRTEIVALPDADGRVLAEDVHALVDLPGASTAAMDGWAVDGLGPWQIVGTVSAGDASVSQIEAGQCVRIGTGALVPAGCARVIPWECARVEGAYVTEVNASTKSHIRPRGEERRAGDMVAVRGTRLNPVLIGHVAALGHDQVCVARRPTVHLIVLGDEVVTAGVPRAGEVRDALGVQIPMWITRLGGLVESREWLQDDPGSLTAVLTSAPEGSLLLTTGGTSRGHRDHLRESWIAAGGTWVVDGVHVRPGHPMMLGQRGATVIIGLPGNPLSALVALVTLVSPVLDTRLGVAPADVVHVRVGESISTTVTRLLVGLRHGEDFIGVDRVSSSMLAGLACADGWAVVEAPGVNPGDRVEWLSLPW